MRRVALLCVLFLWAIAPACRAADGPVVHVFWREGCPHCERLRAFLARRVEDGTVRDLREYEISRSARHRRLLADVSRALAQERVAVPFVVIGDRVFVGYLDDASTGSEIMRAVADCRTTSCPDVVGAIDAGRAPPSAADRTRPADAASTRNGVTSATDDTRAPGTRALPTTIDLPWFGAVDPARLSLPVLTVALGALDGFNPCAMWALVFLIGLLLGMQDRTRMWLLGGAFLLTSGAVYYLFMAAWLNALLALGMVTWVRSAIGVLALGGAAWYLREFALHRDQCVVTGAQERRRVFERLRSAAVEHRFWLALAAIVLLAVAVNLVELVCSAGIPAVYTQVLALTPMPTWQYHAYLALYLLVFMLDDLIVFAVAMLTLRAVGPGTAYAHWSHLVGGIVLLVLGVLLLIAPQWLVFGG